MSIAARYGELFQMSYVTRDLDQAMACLEQAVRLAPGKLQPADAMKILMRHNWPGNIRELENVVERMVFGEHTFFVGEIANAAFLKPEDTPVLRMEDTRMNYGG